MQRVSREVKQYQAQPHKHTNGSHGKPQGVTFALGWLLLPVCLVCIAVYRWRVIKARMGYRRVSHD